MSLSAAALLLVAVSPVADSRAEASIYAELTMRNDSILRGILRWNEEESLWLHHFNGTKLDAFDLGSLPDAIADLIRDGLPGKQFEINNRVVELSKVFGRQELQRQDFAIEFGAIERIKMIGEDDDRIDIVLRDGTLIEANGGSNDIDTDLELIGSDGNVQEVDWDDIEQIQFKSAPADHPLFEPHLYGTAKTSAGAFSGLIAWDRDEAYGSQKLDAETDQGDLEILFSEIVELARDGKGTQVTTRDGKQQWLTGTNDVNQGNRGLMINVPDIGLIEVSWSKFDSLRYEPLPVELLPDRSAWNQSGPIRGELSDDAGQSTSGLLTFDLNQSHQAEHLNGKQDDIEYTIAWGAIAQLTATPESAAVPSVTVNLSNGKRLTLTGTSQVKRGNFGWMTGDPVQHLPWSKFVSASLDQPSQSAQASQAD